MVAMNCTGLEDELNVTPSRSADPNRFVYHRLLEYLNMVFTGELETHLHGPALHGLEDRYITYRYRIITIFRITQEGTQNSGPLLE